MSEVGRIIVLEGNIGAGKSTLAAYLVEHKGAIMLDEPVDQDLLAAYLTNRPFWAFPFQLVMLNHRLARYHQALQLVKDGRMVIIDRGLLGDRAFEQMLHQEGLISDQENICYQKRACLSTEEQPSITTYYLDLPAELAFQRMLKRGINGEVETYTLDYMERLRLAHELLLDERVVRLDAALTTEQMASQIS